MTYSAKGGKGTFNCADVEEWSGIGGLCEFRHIPAHYYGTDDDHAKKKYSVDKCFDGGCEGEIAIYFGGSGTFYTDEIRLLRLKKYEVEMNGERSETIWTLFMIIYHQGKYGPRVYRLIRRERHSIGSDF